MQILQPHFREHVRDFLRELRGDLPSTLAFYWSRSAHKFDYVYVSEPDRPYVNVKAWCRCGRWSQFEMNPEAAERRYREHLEEVGL